MLDPARPVRDVRVGGGLVVAGGDAIHMLRPGAVRPAFRKLPAGTGLVAVAVEPWAPFRYAVASTGQLEVFSGRNPDELLFDMEYIKPEAEPTHLAWARYGGESMLFMRGRDSQLGRFRPDSGALEFMNTPPLAAIAGDASGALATIDFTQDLDACITRDGKTWGDVRPVTMYSTAGPGKDLHVHFALSGSAVAYSVDNLGTFVSWGPEQRFFDLCSDLMWGPIAFHGDDALVCAYSVEEKSRVCRRTRKGDTTCLFEVETEWRPDVAMEISAIAWDASRRTLWGASPGAGLLVAKEPGAKGTKGLLVN
jgi:hypothetical protein